MSQVNPEDIRVSVNDKGEHYIRNKAAVGEVVRNIREGHYCTIVGPHYREKSLLLRDIKDELETTGSEFCILIDLLEHRSVDDSGFLKHFGRLVSRRIRERRKDISVQAAITDELSLQNFLEECPRRLEQNLVLLIDHLEVARIGPVESLLRVLRAVYNISIVSDAPYRLAAITASSLSAAEMSLGPTSPFNIARLTWVHDLTPGESRALALATLEKMGAVITPEGLEHMLRATSGDRYLIRSISKHCAELAVKELSRKITEQDVEQAIESLLSEETTSPAPLREAVRELESKPDRLMNSLMILNSGAVPRRELWLDISGDVDELELSGAVRLEEVGGEQVCRIRNEIYERYLKKHFHPERIVNVLRAANHWYEAIGYLEGLVRKSPEYRATLLGTIVDSIFAAKNKESAFGTLAPRLRRAFGISRAALYIVNPDRSLLSLVSHEGFERDLPAQLDLNEKNRAEIKAYLSWHYQTSNDTSGEQIIYIPLVHEDNEHLGLAIIHGLDADPLKDDFLELLTFLKRVARAVGNVIERERKLMQLTVLNETGKQVNSSLDLEQVTQTIVKAAINAIPGAQRGALLLWDEYEQKLLIEGAEGYRPRIRDEIQMGANEGYVGDVFTKGVARRLDNVLADPLTLLRKDPDIRKQRSVICAPLTTGDLKLGVLCLDNVTTHGAFTNNDLALLSAFATQAAIAIQNARLYTELYNLGININRGNRDVREIFHLTIKSITRLSGAHAANILLLRDTDDPELSVSQKPSMSVSQGLGDDYDDEIRPRPQGLTFHVLRDLKPYWVDGNDSGLGINRLPFEKGTRAYVCLPLMSQNKTIGVLFIHYREPHAFSAIEVKVLSLFANQAALAIQNTRQRDELIMTKAVAWMGIVFSSVAHRISQKAGAIRNTVWMLRRW